jgi:hypothetical protein
MQNHPVVIGLADHLLPHPYFPWQLCKTIITYDRIEPFEVLKDAGDDYKPTQRVWQMIETGKIESLRSVYEISIWSCEAHSSWPHCSTVSPDYWQPVH